MPVSPTTLIIAFYNNLNYLQLVLAGLERQTFTDFEIIIADDGSDSKIVSELKILLTKSSLNIDHIWHEDKGFRKNRILNKAILKSAAPYLIFIDGDCIPHKEFVNEHLKNAAENRVLTGRRVNLSEIISSNLTPDLVKKGFLDSGFLMLLKDGLFGRSKDVEKAIYLRSAVIRKILNRKKRGLLGCNMSVHKNDILNINGFDERYEAPSVGEDTDLQFRFELKEMAIKSLNQMAIQYHLYHELQTRPPQNIELFEEVKKSGKAYTPYGINKRKPD
jgi:glycosyltransferase involved in cell wall biosynthesis